jgi:hypothetical protein
MTCVAPPIIIPDYEFKLPGYESIQVKSALGSFHPGPGILTFDCKTIQQYLNVQRMMQLYLTGDSPLLLGAGLNSEDILVQTSVSHELRHFHDWLLSFSYLEAARRRLFLGANALEMFRYLPRDDTNSLFPVPLVDWVLLDERARREKVHAMKNFYDNVEFKICDVPHFSIARLEDISLDSDTLRNGFLTCTRAALSIRMLLNGYSKPGYLRPFDVFELSAVATQFLTIFDRFGYQTALDIYHTSIRNTYYDEVFAPFDELVIMDEETLASGTNFLLLASAMALWAICSGPEGGPMAVEACPSIRFAKLREKLLEDGRTLKGKLRDIEELMSYFDALFDEAPITERVARGTDYFKRITREATPQVAGVSPRHPTAMTLRYWQELLSLREELHRHAFENLYFHIRGAFESTRTHGLTLPPIVVNCTELDPACFADDPLADEFAGNLAGRETMFRLSDRINALKDEVTLVHEADLISSKIFFDQDFTHSESRRAALNNAVSTIVGHRCISFL